MNAKFGIVILIPLMALALSTLFPIGHANAIQVEKDPETIALQALAFPTDFSISAEVHMTHYLENGEVIQSNWRMLRSSLKDLDRMRLEIHAPAERKGTILLALQVKDSQINEKRIWYFNAKKAKSIEITGSKKRKNFLESGFSFEEIAEDYSAYSFYRRLSFTIVNGRNCLLIEGTEKSDLKKPGRRIRLWIANDDLALVKIEYQDKKGRVLKILKAGNFQNLGEITLPLKWEMRDEKRDTRTIINLKNLKLEVNPDEPLFDYKKLGADDKVSKQ